ncbi:hypothetical protein [Scytonema sp. NUACC26]|uniref:hypothetical protein n=1 Tax=Scytonema sp. NUACC26 TaxID=3140176 RepID=UPI0034DBA6EE
MNSQLSATLKPAQIIDPEGELETIVQMMEMATAMMLDAGRRLDGLKEGSVRKFNKMVENRGLSIRETNKLIDAWKISEQLAYITAVRLGIPLLLRLGQPSNKEALEAIAQHEVTQLQATEVIKELRVVNSKPAPEQVEWQSHKDGTRTLVLRLPDCQQTINIEQQWKANPLPTPIFLQQIRPQVEDVCQTVDKELDEYLERQSELTSLLGQIEDARYFVEKYASPSDATEVMMLNRAKEKLATLQMQLNRYQMGDAPIPSHLADSLSC